MEMIDKLLSIFEKLKDFDTWKEFKNDPEWVAKELLKEEDESNNSGQ
jgi:hypothetical protein